MATIPPPRAEGDAGHMSDHDAIRVTLIELDGETTAAEAHAIDTTAVHGIADTGALVLTSDSRMTNARTPTAHKASHSTGGSDALTAANIGAAAAGHNHDGTYAPATHTHAASAVTSGVFAPDRLGTGTRTGAKFLRDDGLWALPASGGTGGSAPGGPVLVIAAADSPSRVRDGAGVVLCDGTNDADIINGAIRASYNQITGSVATKYGAIQLADGTYFLNKPILIPARGFSIKGQGWNTILRKASSGNWSTTGQGSVAALIKMDITAPAQAASSINIEDMYLVCSNSGTVTGIYLENDGDSVQVNAYGYPIAAATADRFNRIRGVRVENCANGIYLNAVGSSNRHSFIEGCTVHTVASGGSAFFIDTSDNEILNCTACGDPDGATNVTGFNIAGSSTIISHCKAFYFDNSGGVGFNFAASRISGTALEGQDCNTSFKVGGSQNSIVGARADTQVAAAIAFDLRSGTNGTFTGLYASLRAAPGQYSSATLALPDTSTAASMRVDAFIDNVTNDPMTKPVSKGTGFTAVTSGASIPTGIKATIVVYGNGVYAN